MESLVKILQERGWCKGIIQNHDGNVCLLGALIHRNAASSGMIPESELQALFDCIPDELQKNPVVYAFMRAGHQRRDGQMLAITSWNDSRALFEEVLEVARKFDAMTAPKAEDKQAVETLIEETATAPAID